MTETSDGALPRHVSALREFQAERDRLTASRKLARQLPIHFPLRRFNRNAPTNELIREEQRPEGYLPLWPYLYRFYGADQQPLYIGISSCYATRLDNHRRRSEWWPLAEYIAVSAYLTHDDVLDAERSALRAERPRFNRQGVRWPAYANLRLDRPAEDAADLLLRQARPEYRARLIELLQDPARAPQPAPPPARFADEL